MDNYEIIKDLCPDYGVMCNKCNLDGRCTVEYTANSLIIKNYRKIGDDELVIKKGEYEALKNAAPIVKVDIGERFLNECEYEMRELEATNKRLKQEVKSLESGLALLQKRYEELGIEIRKYTCIEPSLDESVRHVVDYINIPAQKLAIPRVIIGDWK